MSKMYLTPTDFLNFIQTQPWVLLDGAMGTQLDQRGLMGRGENNLAAPEVVWEIHRVYAQCGCHALTTNTLTTNRIYLETHRMNVDVRDVNRAGVELARQAADGRYVLGNLGPTGQLLAPYGNYTEADFYDAFREQAEVLAEAGVDGFLIETMFDLREALCVLRACQENFSLPVLVSLAFATEDRGGRTMMGNSAEECARRLTEAGADVIGANCGDLDLSQMAVVVSLLRSATSRPVLAQPNAGKPRLVEGRTVFDLAPAAFAEGMVQCVYAGARLVGGCCGTSPEHIRAVAGLLDEMEREERKETEER
jgi:5-methyltetrahydrofolate--homocysteine methyltransferase